MGFRNSVPGTGQRPNTYFLSYLSQGSKKKLEEAIKYSFFDNISVARFQFNEKKICLSIYETPKKSGSK